MREDIGVFHGKEYIAVEYKPNPTKASACDFCAFELGKCRAAIWALGQCYLVDGETIIKNVYYEELTKS